MPVYIWRVDQDYTVALRVLKERKQEFSHRTRCWVHFTWANRSAECFGIDNRQASEYLSNLLSVVKTAKLKPDITEKYVLETSYPRSFKQQLKKNVDSIERQSHAQVALKLDLEAKREIIVQFYGMHEAITAARRLIDSEILAGAHNDSHTRTHNTQHPPAHTMPIPAVVQARGNSTANMPPMCGTAPVQPCMSCGSCPVQVVAPTQFPTISIGGPAMAHQQVQTHSNAHNQTLGSAQQTQCVVAAMPMQCSTITIQDPNSKQYYPVQAVVPQTPAAASLPNNSKSIPAQHAPNTQTQHMVSQSPNPAPSSPQLPPSNAMGTPSAPTPMISQPGSGSLPLFPVSTAAPATAINANSNSALHQATTHQPQTPTSVPCHQATVTVAHPPSVVAFSQQPQHTPYEIPTVPLPVNPATNSSTSMNSQSPTQPMLSSPVTPTSTGNGHSTVPVFTAAAVGRTPNSPQFGFPGAPNSVVTNPQPMAPGHPYPTTTTTPNHHQVLANVQNMFEGREGDLARLFNNVLQQSDPAGVLQYLVNNLHKVHNNNESLPSGVLGCDADVDGSADGSNPQQQGIYCRRHKKFVSADRGASEGDDILHCGECSQLRGYPM
eukprot:TRINITY_DN67542_c6_g6_i1.p1 TRINITY_DN67542_c6_g6~~TRINITY_DN67542_c6_g6_i1.p1  ORF type:complete len:710 (-),score=36.64 TRINITY_DN67542_c6_g6_i1:1325-3142(-)